MQKLRLSEGQTLLRRPSLQVAEPGMNPGLCGPMPRLPLRGDAELTGKRVGGEGVGTG